MKFKFFVLLLTFLGVVTSCVDRDYDIDNIQENGSSTVLKGLEIPIGNFQEVTLKDLKGFDGYSLIPLPNTDFRMHAAFQVEGMGEVFSGLFNIPEAELHMVIRNTLPFDFDITATPMYDREYPVEGAEIRVISGGSPHVAAGTIAKPSLNELTFKIDFTGYSSINFDVLRIELDGQTGKNIGSIVLNDNQGIKLNDVYVKCPNGVKL